MTTVLLLLLAELCYHTFETASSRVEILQGTQSPNSWARHHGIEIPPSLQEKMDAKYIGSIAVLSELVKMGKDSLLKVTDGLELDLIEKAIFNAMLSKLAQGQPPIMSITPEIISITDNKNGAVNIQWKLLSNAFEGDITNQLRLEWAEDDNGMRFDHTKGKFMDSDNQIELETIYETSNILIHDVNANLFRLNWCSVSNTKDINMKTENWDSIYKGKHISVQGNVIQHTAEDSWCGIYGQVVCKSPYIYHWKFKLKAFADNFMFGVSRMSNKYRARNGHPGKDNIGYSVLSRDTVYVYNTGNHQDFVGKYGIQRFNKNGCELDMYLDLTNYKLSFKTGGQDTGVVIQDLAQENYRMIVSLYNKQQIELVAFDYH